MHEAERIALQKYIGFGAPPNHGPRKTPIKSVVYTSILTISLCLQGKSLDSMSVIWHFEDIIPVADWDNAELHVPYWTAGCKGSSGYISSMSPLVRNLSDTFANRQ